MTWPSRRALGATLGEVAVYIAGGLLLLGLVPLLAHVGRVWDLDGGRSALLVFTAGALAGTLVQLLGAQGHPALVAWGLVARGAGLLALVHLSDRLPRTPAGHPHPLTLLVTWILGYFLVLRLSEWVQQGAQQALGLGGPPAAQRPTPPAAATPVRPQGPAAPAPPAPAPARPAPAAPQAARRPAPVATVAGRPVQPAAAPAAGEDEIP